jgi:hypothetical protein
MVVDAAAAPAATLDAAATLYAAASTGIALAMMAAARADNVEEATMGAATGAGPTNSESYALTICYHCVYM